MAQQPSNKSKEVAKQASRPVASGPKRTAPTKAKRRSTSSLLTWGAIALVVVIVAVLIGVKLFSGSSTPSGGNGYEAAPKALVEQVTQIPQSVYDTVGITSPAVPVSKPTEVKDQPPLTLKGSTSGKPATLYIGAEYCPYCAAQRWSVVAALSRFGSFTGLGLTASSTSDVFPGTPSFTFYKSTFSSQYLDFKGVEQFSNVPDPGKGYTKLEPLTQQQVALITKYDTTKYLPGASPGAIPFLDMGNRFFVAGASYSPSVLDGLSRNDIASNLSDPNNPATQAIVATANYLTASICATTKDQPSNVCSSKGVTAAKKAMGL